MLCNNPDKIIEFGLDGHLIKDIPIDFYACSFAFQSPNSCIFYVNQNHSPISGRKNILITDSLFNVKIKMFDMPENLKGSIKFSGGIFPINGNTYFSPALTNIFYLSKGDTLIPKFEIDYGSLDIPKQIKENVLLNNLKDYGFQYNSFIKTKEFIGFNYHCNRVMAAFYDVKSGNILTSDLKSDSLNLLFSNLIFQRGDTIISVLDLNRLSPFILRNKMKIENRFPGLLQKIKIKDTSQNPVLMLYKLKSI